MSEFIPKKKLPTDPYEIYKDRCRTGFKNHSLLRKDDSSSYIELKRDFFEAGIDDLGKHLSLLSSGIDEITPRERLLVELLKCYGFESAYGQAKYNSELNRKFFP